MPPKKRAPATKLKSKTTARLPAAPSVPLAAGTTAVDAVAALSAEPDSHSEALGSSGRKRVADSPEHDVAIVSKKAKVAKADDDSHSSEDEEIAELEQLYSSISDEDFYKLRKLRETLSSHIPHTMGYILKGIKYEKAVPEEASLAELVDIVIEELMRRSVSGKGIADELVVIHDVDDKWHDGEYDDEVDDDDDGLPKDVRKRLSHAESMLQYMAGGALKSIMRQLNPYSRGAGTNRGTASMIVTTLENMAKDGSDIKWEYMIVKSFGMGCGNNSDPDLNFECDEYDDDE